MWHMVAKDNSAVLIAWKSDLLEIQGFLPDSNHNYQVTIAPKNWNMAVFIPPHGGSEEVWDDYTALQGLCFKHWGFIGERPGRAECEMCRRVCLTWVFNVCVTVAVRSVSSGWLRKLCFVSAVTVVCACVWHINFCLLPFSLGAKLTWQPLTVAADLHSQQPTASSVWSPSSTTPLLSAAGRSSYWDCSHTLQWPDIKDSAQLSLQIFKITL